MLNADSVGGEVGKLLSHNAFTYCLNNPVNMSDPTGYLPWIVAGALIGMGIGIVAEVVRQVVSKEKFTMRSVAKIGVAAIAGAASGALMGSSVGLLGAIAGNALISAGSGIINNVIDNKQTTVWSVGTDVGVGGLAGLAGGTGALNGSARNVIFPYTKYSYEELTKTSKKIVVQEMKKATTKTVFTSFANNLRDNKFRNNIFRKPETNNRQYLGDVIKIM